MIVAEIATTGKDQRRRSRNDIKTILRASAISSFNVIARSVLFARTGRVLAISAHAMSLPC